MGVSGVHWTARMATGSNVHARVDRRSLMRRAAVLLAVFFLGLTVLAVIREAERGPTPVFLASTRAPEEARPRIRRVAGELALAGSGSNLPLTRVLAAEFRAQNRDLRVRVHASVGSTGGILAARDGAVDLGLISRPLKGQEQDYGLQWVAYAQVAVVFAAHPTVPGHSLSHEEILALYGGEQKRWRDGSEVVVLQREAGDSAHVIAAQALVAFAEVDATARNHRRWRILYHDRAMQEALVGTPGALGLFDRGGATLQDLPVKVMALGGVEPTEANVRSGTYPMRKTLAFVGPVTLRPVARRFVDFVASARGQALIRRSGYIPVHPPVESPSTERGTP